MFTNQALEYRGMDKIALPQRGSKVVVMAGDINEQSRFWLQFVQFNASLNLQF